MIEAYKKFFKNYARFDGCSSRADYWWVCLANTIIGFALGFVFGLIAGITEVQSIRFVPCLYSLAVIVPAIALIVRRLHDINKSGWYYFMILIPIAGPIIILIYLLTDRVEPNNYGERV